MENDGLIRCYDQLNNTDLPEETMNPVLLPTMEKVFELLIEYHHEKMFHAEGKSEVLRKCNVCQKYQAGPFKMQTSDKVIRSLPFQCTGLAYFDPLYIKCGNHADRRKVSVCLFTCVTVRAIHLEIVAHLSAEKCLLAL